jgi:probable HAF family extracellular repeat protein
MYDVTMTYHSPDKLKLINATPIIGAMPENPPVKVSDKLEFTLTDISVGTELPYRADVSASDEGDFEVSGIRPATHGMMLKGDKITNLGILADKSSSYAYAVSDNGMNITGKSRNAKKKTVPVRFHYEMEEILELKGFGGGRSESRSVNNNDLIAGYANIKTEKGKPRIYKAFYNVTGSELQEISPLGEGIESRAYGVNNNGIVVGWSASKADNSDHIAYAYDTGSKTMLPLGADILGGMHSFAFDVNDSNQAVGVATTPEGAGLAFFYENGVAKDLGSLDDSGYSEARAINDEGQVTGWSLTNTGAYAAFMYDGTAMTPLPGLGGDSKGYGINTHGHIVGSTEDAEENRHAFLYKDGKLTDLYTLLSEKDKGEWKELREAYSISDDGVIVGRGRYYTDKANDKHTSTAFRIKL